MHQKTIEIIQKMEILAFGKIQTGDDFAKRFKKAGNKLKGETLETQETAVFLLLGEIEALAFLAMDAR